MKVMQYITPSRLGGAELHVLALSRLLLDRGHEVTVVCPRGRSLVKELVARGIPHLAPTTMGKLDPVMLTRLVRWLRQGRYDVLHTHLSTASLLGNAAGGLAGVPVVSSVHGMNTATAFRRCRHLVAVSNAVRRHLVAQGIPDGRLTTVYNGIPALLPPAGAREEVRAGLGAGEDTVLVGAVGRLRPEKGHCHLVAAMKHLARVEAQLVLVGQGSEEPALRRQVAELGLKGRVHFAGHAPDVTPYLAAMDLYALPSLREGLSIATIEAMGAGLAVVASRTGGVPEVVDEGHTGVLVAPGDSKALAAALRELAVDPTRRQAMGQAGRQRVLQQFTEQRMVEQIEEVYQRAAGDGPPEAA